MPGARVNCGEDDWREQARALRRQRGAPMDRARPGCAPLATQIGDARGTPVLRASTCAPFYARNRSQIVVLYGLHGSMFEFLPIAVCRSFEFWILSFEFALQLVQ